MNYPDVNTLISSGKKIFRKYPHRTSEFKTMVPGIPLQPRPIITRWGMFCLILNHKNKLIRTIITNFIFFSFLEGTWLDAASYCAEHFDVLKVV